MAHYHQGRVDNALPKAIGTFSNRNDFTFLSSFQSFLFSFFHDAPISLHRS